MEIIALITALIKELIMEYGLWQIAFAVSLPILVLVSPKLIQAITNLIKVFIQ